MNEAVTTQKFSIPLQAQGSPQRESGGNGHYSSREFVGPIPFGDFVSNLPPFRVGPDYLACGLAAAFTSKIDNPVFKLPTRQDERNGAIPAAFAIYAPYYLGTGFTPEQIATDVAEQAAMYLKRLEAEHGYDGYTGRMMSVLRRGHISHHGLQGIEDRNILFDVNDFMATITNRLHHVGQIVVPPLPPFPPFSPLAVAPGTPSPADIYREGTHEKVDPYVESVTYEATPAGYNGRFALPEFIRSEPDQLVALGWDYFDSRALRRGAEFAALAAEKVGEPLVRSALSEYFISDYDRRKEYLLAAH